jgi:uncharacterized protein YbjT (DUF2867 family)
MAPLKIVVLGASKGTGAAAVKEALARGHEVTAFARSPEKLEAQGIKGDKLKLLKGDFHDAASVDAAVTGQDVVVVTASVSKLADFKKNPTYFSQGTGYAITSMRKHGVNRLVVLSALGASESKKLLAWPLRVIMADFILKNAFLDHDTQEHQVRTSGLDWVIARPTRLTDGAAKKQYQALEALKKVPSSISRADVANFLIDAAETRKYVGQAVQLGG